MELYALTDIEGCFDRVSESLSESGWQQHGSDEKWAIWNPVPDEEFLDPRVRWAHLETLESGRQ